VSFTFHFSTLPLITEQSFLMHVGDSYGFKIGPDNGHEDFHFKLSNISGYTYCGTQDFFTITHHGGKAMASYLLDRGGMTAVSEPHYGRFSYDSYVFRLELVNTQG